MNIDGEVVIWFELSMAQGESKEVIYYWFAMRGQTISDEFSLKMAEITGSMFHRRRDQSFIRISVQGGDDVEKVQERIEDFLHDFYPVIREYLPA
jgi:EpsI family protein